MFQNIRVSSAPEALAEEIIRRIRSGELQPGARLPSQRELARMFGVGLGSIREAIKILGVMGCLSVIQGKGTFIADDALQPEKPTTDIEKAFEAISLQDLMKAREVVECAAAEMAAAAADEDHLKRLRALADRMKDSYHEKELFYQLDFAFHMAVAEASNNQAIIEIAKLLVERAHNYIGFMDNALGISMPFNVERAVDTARQVVSLIESKQGKASSRAMREHLNIVNTELKKEFTGAPSRADATS
ncbi:MAG: FCD domain-containing protein [Desulfobacterales bacterium]|jgi:GntR family transcriptional repressor for pyruvate dehydrogenase complex